VEDVVSVLIGAEFVAVVELLEKAGVVGNVVVGVGVNVGEEEGGVGVDGGADDLVGVHLVGFVGVEEGGVGVGYGAVVVHDELEAVGAEVAAEGGRVVFVESEEEPGVGEVDELVFDACGHLK